jgi:hypothetical protein
MSVSLQKLLLSVTVITLAIAGCAHSGNYGTLHRDRELDRMFLSSQVLPGYKYYISGGYDKPIAILGIHHDYHLVSNLWLPVPNVDSGLIQKWVQTIDPESRETGHSYFAYFILDPDGRRAGFWYSIQHDTVVKFLDEHKIEVYTPDLIQPGDAKGGDDRRMQFKPR